jgi:hypothetical protein
METAVHDVAVYMVVNLIVHDAAEYRIYEKASSRFSNATAANS